jgi:hypothetical protein
LILIVVLLCQGLIFEIMDDPERVNNIVMFFGVFIVVLLTGTVVLSFVRMFFKILRNQTPLVIPLSAVRNLSNEAKKEVMQLLINKQMESFAEVNISQADLARNLGKDYLVEIYFAVDASNALTQNDVIALSGKTVKMEILSASINSIQSSQFNFRA